MKQVFARARRVLCLRESHGSAFVLTWVEAILNDTFFFVIFAERAHGVDRFEANVATLGTADTPFGDGIEVARVGRGTGVVFGAAIDFSSVLLEWKPFRADGVPDRRADRHPRARLGAVVAADALDLYQLALLVERTSDFLAQVFALASLAAAFIELVSMFARLALQQRTIGRLRGGTIRNSVDCSRATFLVATLVNTPARIIRSALNCLPRSVIVALCDVLLLRRHSKFDCLVDLNGLQVLTSGLQLGFYELEGK